MKFCLRKRKRKKKQKQNKLRSEWIKREEKNLKKYVEQIFLYKNDRVD